MRARSETPTPTPSLFSRAACLRHALFLDFYPTAALVGVSVILYTQPSYSGGALCFFTRRNPCSPGANWTIARPAPPCAIFSAPSPPSNSRPKGNPKAVQAEVAQGLPQPGGGRKEYTEEQGQSTKVREWFGYKLHLLVGVKHEVALAYHVTDTKTGDNERVAALVEQAEAN